MLKSEPFGNREPAKTEGATGEASDAAARLDLARLRADNGDLRLMCERYRQELEAMRNARAALAAELDALLANAPLRAGSSPAALAPATRSREQPDPQLRPDALALGGPEELMSELQSLRASERAREIKARLRPWYKKLIKYPRKTLLALLRRLGDTSVG